MTDTDYKKLWRAGQKEAVKAHNKNFVLITILNAVVSFVKDKVSKEDYEKIISLSQVRK